MNDTLTTALEHPANDLRDLYRDHYPDAHISKGRTAAVWRGGDSDNVTINSKTMHDFVSGETYNAWTLLTELTGYSKEEAAAYLISRAGLSDTPQAKRRAARRVKREKATDVRAETVKARVQAGALAVQRTAATEGVSAYLARKGVTELFGTHRVAPAYVDGQAVPGMVYATDEHGDFVQLVLRDLGGAVCGFQRLYDSERGKRFVYGSRPTGAFVLLEPQDKKPPRKIKGMLNRKAVQSFQALPKTGPTMAGLLATGYELGVTEGVATGASVALARPHSFVCCAVSAGNLAPVTAALRKAYGYLHTLDDGRKKAIHITIWADLDESKTGQEKAHRAALESGCYVRLPKFKHGYGDFNDLHLAKGLEAVKRTRKVTPDAALAFAKELSKQKLSPDKHLAPFALPDSGAALVIKAPQESGKTHRLAELLRGQGLRVLVVTHRESLAKNLAARLHFECYNDYQAHLLRDIPRLVICFDSLQKLTISGALPNYDLVVFDESEQVLEHTTGRQIKRKAQNFGVLEYYLKTAPRIICADANAGHLTADTLKRYNPERRISWHKHEHHIAAGRRLRLTHDRDDVLDALEAETRPAWVASDSLRFTRDLSSYLDDPSTLTINSETATTDAAATYLLDPTGQAKAHGRMIVSPSVQTGLSDDSGHWQHVFGSFTGYSSTPQDAMQAVMRARRVQELTVYAARGRGEALTVQEALENAATADDFEAKGLQRDSYGTQNPNYERLRAEVASQRSWRQANYKKRFALEAALLGYGVQFDVARDLKVSEVERREERHKALKEAGLERYVHDRVAAERIGEAKAKAYEEAYSLSQHKFFALEQYKLRAFYRLPDDVSDEHLDEMLRKDDYKALRTKVERYENFLEPREIAEARASGDLEGGVLRGDVKGHLLRFEYHRRLGEVVGMNAETETRAQDWKAETDRLEGELHTLRTEAENAQTRRKGELNKQIDKLEKTLKAHMQKDVGTTYRAADNSVRAFVKWCCKHHRELKHAGLVTASRENLKAKPLETIGDSLERSGLLHRRDKKRAQREYAVRFVSVSGMWNYSRHRRENWLFAQQKNIKTLDSGLLRKNALLASQTGLITATANAKNTSPSEPTPTPARRYEPTPETERVSPWKTHGYEALRALVREQRDGETRTQLLETFRWADHGDAAALADLTGYMQSPQVQRLLGMGA